MMPAAEPIEPATPARTRILLLLLVLVALVTRLSFVMHSFDEPLSIQLADSVAHHHVTSQLAVRSGQLLYLAIVQALNHWVGDPLTSLSVTNAIFSSLALGFIFFAVRAIWPADPRVALAAAALTAFSYGFWIVGLRPVSDPVAAFFVYAAVCGLVAGLDRATWYFAAMAAAGLAIGVEVGTVCLLAPLAAVVTIVVVRRAAWKVAVVGVVIVCAVCLAWLVPSVLAAGGWAKYEVLLETAGKPIYTAQNIAAHLARAQLRTHAWQDLVQIWGSPVLAAVALPLALAGLVPLWRAGLRGRLMILFGVSVLAYVFLAIVPTSRFYVYTAPALCISLASGLFWISNIFPRYRSGVIGGLVAAFVLTELCVSLPVAAEVKSFRSPSQAALAFLQRRVGGALKTTTVYTDSEITEASLNYDRAKTGFALLDAAANYPQLLALLGARKPFYILSTLPCDRGGTYVEPLEQFTWKASLRNILQSNPESGNPRDLYLSEVVGRLPDSYQKEGALLEPVLFGKQTWRDGLVGPEGELVLPSDGSGAAVVQVEGIIPPEYDFYFPFKVSYTPVDGGQGGEFTVSKPGAFSAVLTLTDLPPGNAINALRLTPAEYCIPAQTIPGSSDGRRLSLGITRLRCTSAEHPLRLGYGSGWYDPESDRNGTWRWCGAEGGIDLVIGHGHTVALTGEWISFTAENSVEVLIDGKIVAAAQAPEKSWSASQTMELPIGPGVYHLIFRSRQPAVQPSAGDARLLGFGLRNLRVTME